MTQRELYKCLAAKTGDDIETIENLGFKLHVPLDETELQCEYRPKQRRQERHTAAKIQRAIVPSR